MASRFVNDACEGRARPSSKPLLGQRRAPSLPYRSRTRSFTSCQICASGPSAKCRPGDAKGSSTRVQRRHLSAGGSDLSGLSRRENARRTHPWIVTARQIVARESVLRTLRAASAGSPPASQLFGLSVARASSTSYINILDRIVYFTCMSVDDMSSTDCR